MRGEGYDWLNMSRKWWRSRSPSTKTGILLGVALCSPAAIYGGLLGGTLLGGWSWTLAGAVGTGFGILFGFTTAALAVLMAGATLGGAVGAAFALLIRK